MSNFNLGKKLQPAKKAWNCFKSKLEKKFHKLNRSKPIKKTTHRFNTTISSVICHSKAIRGGKRPRPPSIRLHHHHNPQSFAPVYIDELFVDPLMVKENQYLVTNKKVGEKAIPSSTRIVDASRTTVEMKHLNGFPRKETSKEGDKKGRLKFKKNSMLGVTLMRGVDERAEEFIAKFKEDMRLQRERSLEEYQEMLARGV